MRFRKDRERGATMIEYALVAALIAIVSISAVTFLGKSSADIFAVASCIMSFEKTSATTGTVSYKVGGNMYVVTILGDSSVSACQNLRDDCALVRNFNCVNMGF